MADKVPTPGMPDRDATGHRPKGNGVTDGLMPADTRGAGGGGPVGPKTSGKFRGGQSGAAYHGHGQLGEQEIDGQENVNAVSRED